MFEIGTQTKCLNLHILNKLFKFSFWQKELMWHFLFAWSTPWNIGFFLTFFSWRKLCFSILPPNSCYVFMFFSSIFIPMQCLLNILLIIFKIIIIIILNAMYGQQSSKSPLNQSVIINWPALLAPILCLINNFIMHLIFSPNDLDDFPMIPQWKSSLMFHKKTDNQWYWKIGKYFTQQPFHFILC